MKTQTLQERIASPEYDFLQSSPLLSNSILLCVAGSRAYRTNNDDSDWDIRGVIVEPKNVLFGLQTFEQYVDEKTDTVLFGLKKFCQLAMKANPNVLDILFCERDDTQFTATGHLLLQHRELFLSKRITSTTLGCVKGNRHRIEKAIADGELAKANKYLMQCVRLLYAAIHCHSHNFYPVYQPEHIEEFRAIREEKFGVQHGDWRQRLDELENQLKKADENSVLPNKVNTQAIEEMMYEIYKTTI